MSPSAGWRCATLRTTLRRRTPRTQGIRHRGLYLIGTGCAASRSWRTSAFPRPRPGSERTVRIPAPLPPVALQSHRPVRQGHRPVGRTSPAGVRRHGRFEMGDSNLDLLMAQDEEVAERLDAERFAAEERERVAEVTEMIEKVRLVGRTAGGDGLPERACAGPLGPACSHHDIRPEPPCPTTRPGPPQSRGSGPG